LVTNVLKSKKVLALTLAALLLCTVFAVSVNAVTAGNIFTLATDFEVPANHNFGTTAVSSPAALGGQVTVTLGELTIYGRTGYISEAYETTDIDDNLVTFNSTSKTGTLIFTSSASDKYVDGYYFHPIVNVGVTFTSGGNPHTDIPVAFIQYQLAPTPTPEPTTTEAAE
jgi:hypothetical protein